MSWFSSLKPEHTSSNYNPPNINCLFIGEQGVGKSTLIARMKTGDYQPQKPTTIPVNQESSSFTHIHLAFYDCPGMARFQPIMPSIYNKAQLVFMTFNVNDRASFDKVSALMDSVKQHTPQEALFYLVGTQADSLAHSTAVSPGEAEQLAKRLNCVSYFPTSAKTGKGLKSFFDAANEYLKRTTPEGQVAIQQPVNLGRDEDNFKKSQAYRPIHAKHYDPSHIGQAVTYSSLFAKERAIFKGQRKPFENTWAWLTKRKFARFFHREADKNIHLFANTKSLFWRARPLFANTKASYQSANIFRK